MMTVSWKAVLPLCLFGFLKEFRPSESFITQYLVGPDKNFTKAQVNQDIYPVGTYSNLSLLILVFLLTDLACYKPIIILEGFAGVATYCFIIWGHDLPSMQTAEFFYGLFMATEVAYLTYLYAMCDKKHFQRVSGCVRSGILLGRFISGLTSQLAISFHILNYHQLNFLTLAGVSFSVPVAVFLPSVKKSVYFHRESKSVFQNETIEIDRHSPHEYEEVNIEIQNTESQPSHLNSIILSARPKKRSMSDAFNAMYCDLLSALKDVHILKWSLWWCLATCGYLQVTSYIQMLWQVTAEKDELLYNGVVDAVYTLIGALATWFVGQQKLNLKHYTSFILTMCCLLQGASLLASAAIPHLLMQYVLYIFFKVLYHSTMVLASSEVASSLKSESHALVFGLNMFVALCLQSAFTSIVAARGGLELDTQTQFFVYGAYFVFLGVGFMLSLCMTQALRCLEKKIVL